MKKQRGMTFIGVVLLVAVIVFVAVIGMKLAPAYLEYFSVKKAIAKIANDPGFSSMGKNDVTKSFDKSATIDDIRSIEGKELEISKNESGLMVVTADYQVLVPLMGNVSALLDFSASTDSGRKAAPAAQIE